MSLVYILRGFLSPWAAVFEKFQNYITSCKQFPDLQWKQRNLPMMMRNGVSLGPRNADNCKLIADFIVSVT